VLTIKHPRQLPDESIWDAEVVNLVLVDCARELSLPEPAALAVLPRRRLVRVNKAVPPTAEAQQLFSSTSATAPPNQWLSAAAAPPWLLTQQQAKRPEGRSNTALLVDAFRSGDVWNYVRHAASQQHRSGHGGFGAFGSGSEGGTAPRAVPSMLRFGKGR
jgi:hypothetical protein